MAEGLTDEQVTVAADHGCFGCGALNPHGLKLTFFRTSRGGVWSPFTPARHHEGYDGLIHGGIVASVLDEVTAWSLYGQSIWAVTAKMEIRFRQPLFVGQATIVEGWLEIDRGRVLETRGEIRDRQDERVVASATATFIRVSADQEVAWRARYLGSPTPQASSAEPLP